MQSQESATTPTEDIPQKLLVHMFFSLYTNSNKFNYIDIVDYKIHAKVKLYLNI